MKRLYILLIAIFFILVGCSQSNNDISVNGKVFNEEKFTELSEEQKELLQRYINCCIELYNNTDYKAIDPANFYLYYKDEYEKSPNDYYYEMSETEEIKNYAEYKYNNKIISEHDKRVYELTDPIWLIHRAYLPISKKYMSGTEHFKYDTIKIKRSEWNTFRDAIQEAIDFCYIDE